MVGLPLQGSKTLSETGPESEKDSQSPRVRSFTLGTRVHRPEQGNEDEGDQRLPKLLLQTHE